MANLNGVWYLPGTSSFAQGIVWESWKGFRYSLKATAMMVTK